MLVDSFFKEYRKAVYVLIATTTGNPGPSLTNRRERLGSDYNLAEPIDIVGVEKVVDRWQCYPRRSI